MESTFRAFDPQRIIEINKQKVGRDTRNQQLIQYVRERINATAARVHETSKLDIEIAHEKLRTLCGAAEPVGEVEPLVKCCEAEIKKEVVLALLAWATS